MTDTEYQQLVEFLGRRFTGIDQRFDAIEVKLREHDERFGDILAYFDQFYTRLEGLEQEYRAILQALRRIEALLADEQGRGELLERSVQELKRQVAALQDRISDLERRLHE